VGWPIYNQRDISSGRSGTGYVGCNDVCGEAKERLKFLTNVPKALFSPVAGAVAWKMVRVKASKIILRNENPLLFLPCP
jgi:hypothetical protein